MNQEQNLNDMQRENIPVSIILPNSTVTMVTETPMRMISIPDIDVVRQNTQGQRQIDRPQDYTMNNEAISDDHVTTYRVVLPSTENSETYAILSDIPRQIKAESTIHKGDMLVAGSDEGGSVQIGENNGETVSVQLAVPENETQNLQITEDRKDHVFAAFQEHEKGSVQVVVPDKEQESVQLALQSSENVVFAIDDSENTQRIVRIDSTQSECQNYTGKTSLQNLVQLLQQGSVQIELPAGLNSDQSVLLSDLISNEIAQAGDIENQQQSDTCTVNNAEYAISHGNLVTVTQQELDGKGNVELMQVDNTNACKNEARSNVGRSKQMVSILKSQLEREPSGSTVPTQPTVLYAVVQEGRGTPVSNVERISEQEKAKQDKINKDLQSLSNKKEILSSLLENIKTQMEIFRTEVININISTVQEESYLFLTSKVIYQMLKPLLELAAEIKQFADQGQFSWKQDSYSQTDGREFAARNAWTQTPAISAISGREIRQPSRFQINQDSDSDNEGRRQSKRKRKHTLRYLRSSKLANLQNKIAYVPAVDIKIERVVSDEVDPTLNERIFHNGEDLKPDPSDVVVPAGEDPQTQTEISDIHTEGDPLNMSGPQGNQSVPTSTECASEECLDKQSETDMKAEDTSKVSLVDPDCREGGDDVTEPAPPPSVSPESQNVLQKEAENESDEETSDIGDTVLQDHKLMNDVNVISQNSLTGSEVVAPGDKSAGSKGRRKTWKDYESLSQYKFFCPMCSFKTKRQSHYLKHLKYHDKQPKLYYCKLCDFKTIRNGELRKHEVNHSGNVIACSLCKYITDDQIAMNRHKRLKHGDKHFVRDHYVCLICKFKSVTLKKLEKHMQQHKSPEDEHVSLTMQYSCDICPYKTKRKEHLIRHKNVHSDHRPYLCDTCGQKFKRTDALTQHKLVHVDKQNRKYAFTCTKCNKGFRSQSHLQEHMAIHSTEKHFLCDICGSAFKTKSSQQKHIKNLHQSPRSFSCQTCDKKFNTNYTLKRHERTHELLPYQKANNSGNVLVGQEFLNQTEVTVTPQDLVQVQDIIAPSIEETYDSATDKLQQAFSSLNNENSTAIMYLSSSLPASWT